MVNLNGMTVIARTKDAVYLRIPREAQREIPGGCHCDHCKQDPRLAMWDTLVVPTERSHDHAHTVHMPDASVQAFVEYNMRIGNYA